MVRGFWSSIAERLGDAGRAALLCAALASVGCGGRVIETGPEDPRTGTAGSSAANSTAGASSKGSGGGSLPTHALGACVPGFDHASNPGRACQWLTSTGQCFDDFDAACACACPTAGSSVCSSSLPGDSNSATRVFCDAT